MMQTVTFLSQVKQLPDDREFGRAYSVTVNKAKRCGLYQLFTRDFETVQILGFKHKDREQAGFALERLAAKLECEISMMEAKT